MNAVLLGATKGMGRALARALAERGDALFLLGRNAEDLARSARDLALRGAAGSVGHARCDLAEPASFAPALAAAAAQLGHVDLIVLSAGLFATQEALEQDGALRERLLTLDFTHSVGFCEAARELLLAQGGGTLCVFSSVAGDAARKPVVLYGAAKAGLTHYLEGLDRRFSVRGLRVVIVKPGFVRTGMTAGLRPPPFAGDPDDVARTVLAAIDRGRTVVYAPRIWRLVMAAVRRLPRAVMRRVGF